MINIYSALFILTERILLGYINLNSIIVVIQDMKFYELRVEEFS